MFKKCKQRQKNRTQGLKEPYVRLWPKLVLQSLSNYCRAVYPLPPDLRLPDRLQDPTFFFTNTFLAAAVVTRAELATQMPQHY